MSDTLGWILYRKGLYSLAVVHLEKAVNREPTPRHRFHLGLAYYKAGNQARGQEVLQAALKADSTAPEAALAREVLRIR